MYLLSNCFDNMNLHSLSVMKAVSSSRGWSALFLKQLPTVTSNRQVLRERFDLLNKAVIWV